MVYIFLANGFEEIEALYTVDVLRRAGVDIKTVGVGAKTITGSHKITIVCDTTTDEIEPSDELEMIILPGGLPGSTNLYEDACVDKFISWAHENDKFICAICAAPFILGKRGILKGKMAICYPGFENQLNGATIMSDKGCVRDGNIITGRAMGSADEFAFAILSALRGDEAAAKIKNAIILD
ncbi:MAG: DJ-1/PfpI family protein [Ruminococcaceae bacterium]|nr:DJ-1/PfpI family protein [Oscillospiraceae bacterium]